ncbi:MAG: hypothetical protein JJT78_13440 [Leptospira sp.]|nr:hypothetical protein [Leptospira sp.]
MDVRLSNILNSAEKLIKDKNAESKGNSVREGKQEWSNAGIKDTAEFSNLLTGKFQTIQSKLTELQGQFSKEQMRKSYLEENKSQDPAELIHVLFGKEPLFPELQAGNKIDLESLKNQTDQRLSQLETEIRSKEVENENVVSLGLQDNGSDFKNLLKGIETVTWKPMNEKTVQKLIGS